MTKKDVLLFFTFVVAPMGIVAGAVYYGPKIKKWYVAKKEKKAEDGKIR
jgi:hypothetical protein